MKLYKHTYIYKNHKCQLENSSSTSTCSLFKPLFPNNCRGNSRHISTSVSRDPYHTDTCKMCARVINQTINANLVQGYEGLLCVHESLGWEISRRSLISSFTSPLVPISIYIYRHVYQPRYRPDIAIPVTDAIPVIDDVILASIAFELCFALDLKKRISRCLRYGGWSEIFLSGSKRKTKDEFRQILVKDVKDEDQPH